jgi:hypothetical protein
MHRVRLQHAYAACHLLLLVTLNPKTATASSEASKAGPLAFLPPPPCGHGTQAQLSARQQCLQEAGRGRGVVAAVHACTHHKEQVGTVTRLS